jgi:hypothetical protein
VGRGIRQLDPALLVEPDDPDAHEIREVGRVADLLVELELRGVEPIAQSTDEGRHVGRRIVGLGIGLAPDVRARCIPVDRAARRERTQPEAAPGERRPGRLERAIAVEGDADGDREGDREQADEGDEDPVHAASIAQARDRRGTLEPSPPTTPEEPSCVSA